MPAEFTRRDWLQVTAGSALLSATSPSTVASKEAKPKPNPFAFALNTSTLRGHQLSLVQEIDLVAEVGYSGIEPWIREIVAYEEQGGSLKDLGKRLGDRGLKVVGAIGFAEWIVEDPQRRKKGLETAKRDMDRVREIGGDRIAAPPAGATKKPKLDLFRVAERYRTLLDLGQSMGVTPMLEVWGFSENLSRLGETVLVAVEAAHPKACILPDVYHLYKGGSKFTGLSLLRGVGLGLFHINDYPQIPRTQIQDRDRVYPGNGVAPLSEILQILVAIGYRGMLSLELFNPNYWKQDPRTVARTGLARIQSSVAQLQQ